MTEREKEELRQRMAEYNQRAGELFDDWWMFGDRHAIRRLRKMFF